MEMRKFIIEIHPNGTMTCCEYEDPEDTIRASNDSTWLAGYRQALKHCAEQVEALEGIKGDSAAASLMYQGAAFVRDGAAEMYQKYCKDVAGGPRRKNPDCGSCCDYGSSCCDMGRR
jgi:hypothetical protein